MSDGGYWRLSATELIEGYRRRDFSPVEVIRGRCSSASNGSIRI